MYILFTRVPGWSRFVLEPRKFTEISFCRRDVSDEKSVNMLTEYGKHLLWLIFELAPSVAQVSFITTIGAFRISSLDADGNGQRYLSALEYSRLLSLVSHLDHSEMADFLKVSPREISDYATFYSTRDAPPPFD